MREIERRERRGILLNFNNKWKLNISKKNWIIINYFIFELKLYNIGLILKDLF
jgi:hypothetical protein